MSPLAACQVFQPANPKPFLQSFDPFPSLPLELRLSIWELAIPRERILTIYLRCRKLMNKILDRNGSTRPKTHNGDRHGGGYDILIDGCQTISKFFRINQESRKVVTEFYRVQLYCWLGENPSRDHHTLKPGILYFNPECDFFLIKSDGCLDDCRIKCHAPELFYDLKTLYDPRGIGILNLALEGTDLWGSRGFSAIDHTALSPSLKTNFQESFLQLRQFFLVCKQSGVGRYVYGMLNNAPTHDFQENLSFPISAPTVNFTRYQPDPRPIGDDLREILVTGSIDDYVCQWQRLCREYIGDQFVMNAEQRILLTCELYQIKGVTQKDASCFLKKNHESWLAECEEYEKLPNDTSESAVQTAFGFWLFPMDTFSPRRNDANNQLNPWNNSGRFDLSGRWPDLGLMSLRNS